MSDGLIANVFNHDIRIADGGQIGSGSYADSILHTATVDVKTFVRHSHRSGASISAGTGKVVCALDIDGGTDIGVLI